MRVRHRRLQGEHVSIPIPFVCAYALQVAGVSDSTPRSAWEVHVAHVRRGQPASCPLSIAVRIVSSLCSLHLQCEICNCCLSEQLMLSCITHVVDMGKFP